MGLIAKIQSFVRVVRNGAKISDVKVDPGGGANVTAEHFSAPGDDSFPMTGDYAVVSDVGGTGRKAVTGYLDPINDPVARMGEKRIYARNSNGDTIGEIWLKRSGRITILNASGEVTLKATGETTILNVNGQVTLKSDGAVLIGVADEAQVLGDQNAAFLSLVIDEIIGICTASTTMGSVLALSQKAALEALQTALNGNSGDGEIRSNKHKTGLT